MANSPATGERAAVSGFTAQYLVAADLVYRALNSGTLEWVQLVDPEAGRIDDVLIATAGRLDAYQIKWAYPKSTYTFAGVTSGTPSIWRQLADGWLGLRSIHRDRSVRVHFVSNEIASPNSPIPTTSGSQSLHFQDLWSDVLGKGDLPREITALPERFEPAIERLKNLSGLSEADFASFLSTCRLQFDYPDPRAFDADNISAEITFQQVADIAALLQRLVASARGVVRVTPADLSSHLPWLTGLSGRFSHFFAVDELTYRPITQTVDQILRAVDSTASGYFAVIGGPGSGKSTTLTQTLRYRTSLRLVSYYAFLPDDRSMGRGESASFWQDIYVALRDRGFRPRTAVPRSVDDFRAAVGVQFEMASDNWRRNGIKTVLLIDGLDHIDRELRPISSLIASLPLPDQLPEGLVIFLGSQSIELEGLAPSIRAQLDQSGRTITMGRLSRPDVFAIIDSLSKYQDLTVQQKERIYTLGDGHPLATVYLLSGLRQTSTPQQVDHLLEDSRAFDGHIEDLYQRYWRSIRDEPTRNFLALVSRLRIPFDVQAAVQWTPGIDAKRFVETTQHYFVQRSNGEWAFFHNSFRQFLLWRTGVDLLGRPDPAVDRRFHATLAERAAIAIPGTPLSHERLFHLYSSGDFGAVVSLATQQYFRAQLLALRHPQQIRDDISILLRAGAALDDGTSIARGFLIDHEIAERASLLDDREFFASLDVFLEDSQVLQYVKQGNQLFVSQLDALVLAGRLLDRGLRLESQEIFDLAEPIDVLSGTEFLDIHSSNSGAILDASVRLASRFRPVREVVRAIENLRTSEQFRSDGEQVAAVKNRLLTNLGVLLRQQDSGRWTDFCAAIDERGANSAVYDRIDWSICAGGNRNDCWRAAVARLLERYRGATLEPRDRLAIANYLVQASYPHEDVENFIHGIPQPPLADLGAATLGARSGFLSSFFFRIALNRTLAALGRPEPPETVIPWPKEPVDQLRARFERGLASAANLWGRALRGQRLDANHALLEMKSALTFYARAPHHDDATRIWYQFLRVRNDYFAFLIRAVASHGPGALYALAGYFEEVWQDEAARDAWPSPVRRRIIVEFHKMGLSRTKAVEQLQRLESAAALKDEVTTVVEDLIDEARAWSVLGERSRARDLLIDTLSAAFGISHHKDRQIQTWTTWLSRAADAGVGDLTEDCVIFARGLFNIVAGGHGRGYREAALQLVSVVAKHQPDIVLPLRRFLLSSGTIHFSDANEGLITGLLKRTDVNTARLLTFLRHVGIALEFPEPRLICTRLISACERQHGADWTQNVIKDLLRTLSIDTFESARDGWFRAIEHGLASADDAGLRAVAVPASKPSHAPAGGQNLEVMLSDGTRISRGEFEKRIRDFDSLVSALNSTGSESNVRWREVAQPVIVKLSAEQALQLSAILKIDRTDQILVCLHIARRLRELGDNEAADALTARCFEESAPHGWISWYDGGSRLLAAIDLAQAHGTSTRRQVLAVMVSDYLSEVRNPRDFVESLDDMLPILFELVPWSDLWQEIFEHVRQLHDFRSSAPIDHLERQNVTADEVIAYAAIEDLALPIPELEWRYCHLIASWLREGLLSDRELLELATKFKMDLRRWKLAVVLYLSRRRLNDLTPQEARIVSELERDPSVAVRVTASLVDARDSVKPRVLVIKHTESVPIALQMELESFDASAGLLSTTTHADRAIPPPATPADLFRIFRPQLEILSRMSKVPLANLYLRGQQIADSLHNSGAAWDEEEHRRFADGTGLKLTYRRPWAEIAEEAVFYLAAELVDYEFLHPDVITECGLHRLFDSRLLEVEPHPRSETGVSAFTGGSIELGRDKWIEQADLEPIGRTAESAAANGFLTLLEYTRFFGHDWDRESETRLSLVVSDTADCTLPIDPKQHMLLELAAVPAEDYPDELTIGSHLGDLVVGGYDYTHRFGLKLWFAIHPDFAAALGLMPHGRIPFGWVDDQGELRAQSIYWREGPGRRSPPRFGDAYGSGWLVLVHTSVLARSGKDLSATVHRCVRRATQWNSPGDKLKFSVATADASLSVDA